LSIGFVLELVLWRMWAGVAALMIPLLPIVLLRVLVMLRLCEQ
jgi:hypothetical protein